MPAVMFSEVPKTKMIQCILLASLTLKYYSIATSPVINHDRLNGLQTMNYQLIHIPEQPNRNEQCIQLTNVPNTSNLATGPCLFQSSPVTCVQPKGRLHI